MDVWRHVGLIKFTTSGRRVPKSWSRTCASGEFSTLGFDCCRGHIWHLKHNHNEHLFCSCYFLSKYIVSFSHWRYFKFRKLSKRKASRSRTAWELFSLLADFSSTYNSLSTLSRSLISFIKWKAFLLGFFCFPSLTHVSWEAWFFCNLSVCWWTKLLQRLFFQKRLIKFFLTFFLFSQHKIIIWSKMKDLKQCDSSIEKQQNIFFRLERKIAGHYWTLDSFSLISSF